MPAIVDLAAMRDAMRDLGGDPTRINPLQPVELVIDHSVQVDEFATRSRSSQRRARVRAQPRALRLPALGPEGVRQLPRRAARHRHRATRSTSSTWRGSCSASEAGERPQAYPDTLVGTDSHTTMINGLGVLGWGVGGIEAEAAMLGQPVSMLIPQVVGFKLSGELPEGATATDLVLTVTQMLRKKGVVGKFVEFYGAGLAGLPLADRATIAQHGAGVRRDLRDLPGRRRDARLPALHRPPERADRAGRGLRARAGPVPRRRLAGGGYTDTLELDLGDVEPSLAGPRRPQDRVPLQRREGVVRARARSALDRRAAPPSPARRRIADALRGRGRPHGGRRRRSRSPIRRSRSTSSGSALLRSTTARS